MKSVPGQSNSRSQNIPEIVEYLVYKDEQDKTHTQKFNQCSGEQKHKLIILYQRGFLAASD